MYLLHNVSGEGSVERNRSGIERSKRHLPVALHQVNSRAGLKEILMFESDHASIAWIV